MRCCLILAMASCRSPLCFVARLLSKTMSDGRVTVVLPCLNEAESLPVVLAAMPAGYQALVVDNNSPDDTADVARHHGATVVAESRPEVGVYYRGQPEKEFRHRRVAGDNEFLVMDNFARAIETGGETLLDVRLSRAITATVEAAVRSGRSGQVERVV